MKLGRTDTAGVRGVVERRLFDTQKLEVIRDLLASDKNLSPKEIDRLFDAAAKPMFRWNIIGKILGRKYGVDLQIPFLTGVWTKKAVADNLIVTRGKRIIADQVGGTTTAPVTAIALGTGTTAAAASDTALGTEISTGGGSRGAATVTNTTTTTTGDTEQWVKTFSFSSSFAVTEEGLFDNNTSGGNMLARQVFSAVNVANGDSLQITHKVQVS